MVCINVFSNGRTSVWPDRDFVSWSVTTVVSSLNWFFWFLQKRNLTSYFMKYDTTYLGSYNFVLWVISYGTSWQLCMTLVWWWAMKRNFSKKCYRIIPDLTCKFIHICIYQLVFFVWQLWCLWAQVVVQHYNALYVPACSWAKPTCWYMPRMNMEMIEDHSTVQSVGVLPRTRTVCVFMFIYTIERTERIKSNNVSLTYFTPLVLTHFTYSCVCH